MFRVYYINHYYFASEHWPTLDEAVVYAKSKCFECAIYNNTLLVAGWSPIGGLRMYA